jgi:putative Mn2+ efflux pump MntP
MEPVIISGLGIIIILQGFNLKKKKKKKEKKNHTQIHNIFGNDNTH